MKRTDIKQCGIYWLRESKFGNGFRCIVLDTEAQWFNAASSGLWNADPGFRVLRQRPVYFKEKQPRIAVAVEFSQRHREEVWVSDAERDVATWERYIKCRDERGGWFREVWVDDPPVWVPYAVLSRAIISTWDERQVVLDRAAEEQKIAHAIYREQQAKAKAKHEADQIEARKKEAEREKQRAINDERWEQRTFPALIDVGVDPTDIKRYLGAAEVTLPLEVLDRLLERLMLAEAERAETW